MDRFYPHIHNSTTQPSCGHGCPAFDHACEVLGIPKDVNRNEIIVAHRAVSTVLEAGVTRESANSAYQVIIGAVGGQ